MMRDHMGMGARGNPVAGRRAARAPGGMGVRVLCEICGMRNMRRRVVARAWPVAVIGAALLTSACGLQPWVKPYERDRLADPIMTWDRDALSNAYLDHIYESREGSRGATGTAGGGCGCN